MSTLFLALCVVVVVVERLVLITGPLSVMEREKTKQPERAVEREHGYRTCEKTKEEEEAGHY